MLPFALPFAVRSGRIFASLVASFVVLGASATLRAVDPVAAPIISYNPTITQVQGQLPISTAYPIELMLVVPNGSSLTMPFPVTLAVSSTTRPDTVLESAVADFVKLYNAPGDLVAITDALFSGPGVVDADFPDALVYRKTMHAKVNYPATAVAGTYAFKIFANNPLFVSLGVTNQGSEINGSVTAPVAPPANPPIVSISTPANGSTIEVPGGTTFPLSVDFSFTATVGILDPNPRPITAVSADIDGSAISLLPTVLKPTPVTGLGTTSVTVNVSMSVTGVGAHIVTARATNDVGLPAQPAVHTFNVVIRKSPLTVTADNHTRVYGSANPTLTYTIAGFINGETLATSGVTGTPSLSTTATPFSPVLTSGTYPIAPTLGSLASSKYDFVFVNGGLNVTKALLTVQPDSILNKPFGLLIPTLTASITGVIPGDPNTPAYTGSPALSTTASILSLPGSYLISSAVGSLVSNNYSFQFNTAGLTVVRGKIIVTATSTSKTYGANNPSFGYTTSGAVAGDATPFTGTPSLTTAATASSSVAGSPYPIVAAGGTMSSSKYDIEFVNGSLAVNRAALVVSAAGKTKVQGAANPVLTYGISGFVLDQTNSVLTAQPTITTSAVTSSPVGVYPITVSGGSAANYSFSYNNATLTVTEASGGVCMTMEFDGSTAASGTAGNFRTYTMNGVSVKVSAFSRVRPSPGGALVPAYLGVFPGGLGVTDTGEGDGNGNLHTVDNIGRDNFVLFEFSQPVKVNRAFLGYVINDSDLTVWMGNANNPYNNHLTLSDSILNGMTREDNDTTSGNTRWADVNAGQLSGNVLVIAGSLSDTSPDDEFKIGALDFCTVTAPPAPPAPTQYTACGTVYFDVNRNGCRNTDEPGLAGITVKLYRDNCVLVASTITTANGSYCFNVAPGNYEVDVIEIPGLTPTNCDERSFSVTSSNVTIPDIGLGFNFCTLQGLNANGFSHGYWKNNLSKAIENKTSGTQETKANLLAYTSTISSLLLTPFAGMTMQTAVTTMSASDQLKLQLLASEYNYVSGRFINNSQPLTWAFIYWGELVAKNPSNYSSSYRNFVKNWMDAYNNSHGGDVDGPTSY